MAHEMTLRRELQGAGLLGWLILLAGLGMLSQVQELRTSQWLLQSGLLWCLAWQQTWQRLGLNRATADSTLYANLGWANRLTLLRGGLIAATGGFLFQPEDTAFISWLPALLYSVAAMLDRLDGFVARRNGRTTVLGSELDTLFDALGLVVAPLLAVGYGKAHWTYLLVSMAYYFFQWGLHWRRQHARPVFALVPNTLRRTLAGFQMGFIAVALWPAFQASFTQVIGMAFMLPVLIGFGVDWLVVSGRIRFDIPATTQFFSRLAIFSTTVFQPALRILLGIALFFSSRDAGLVLLPGSSTFWPMPTWGLLLGASLVILGLAGRIGALAVLVLLAWFHPGTPVDAATCCVLFSAVWILLLGTGRFSLWQHDDHWVQRVDGT